MVAIAITQSELTAASSRDTQASRRMLALGFAIVLFGLFASHAVEAGSAAPRAASPWRGQDRLVQTEKLASLGQLTAGIAHEIKNPLNFVNNFAHLVQELLQELKEALAPAVAASAEEVRQEVDVRCQRL